MSICRNCETTILSGGVECSGMIFCSEECFRLAFPYGCMAIPDEVVEEISRSIHDGICPVCGGFGPVEAYFTASTGGEDSPASAKTWRVSCQDCEAKRKWKMPLPDIFLWSILWILGWWLFLPFYLMFYLINRYKKV